MVGLETVLGTEHYWAMMLFLSVIPALLQYLTLPLCPESPRYLLINRGKETEAEAGGFYCLWHRSLIVKTVWIYNAVIYILATYFFFTVLE